MFCRWSSRRPGVATSRFTPGESSINILQFSILYTVFLCTLYSTIPYISNLFTLNSRLIQRLLFTFGELFGLVEARGAAHHEAVGERMRAHRRLRARAASVVVVVQQRVHELTQHAIGLERELTRWRHDDGDRSVARRGAELREKLDARHKER